MAKKGKQVAKNAPDEHTEPVIVCQDCDATFDGEYDAEQHVRETDHCIE